MNQLGMVRDGYASFLVRMWPKVNADVADLAAEWYGQIVHIQSGSRITFTDLKGMMDFFRHQTATLETADEPQTNSAIKVITASIPEQEDRHD